jgi:hypothetical protein
VVFAITAVAELFPYLNATEATDIMGTLAMPRINEVA